ncbi:MAG: hypothetical protein MIO90_07935, partial [Methanomassiliicoccales archaeon]|nr:hypothetical protein [Methanomassiliicoccales archaeon]
MGVDLWAKGANAVVIAMATVLILSMLAGTISADQTWTVEMVDPSGSAGTQVSLALDPSGNPHIAYLDTST